MLSNEIMTLLFHLSILLCLLQIFPFRTKKQLNITTGFIAVSGWLIANTGLGLVGSMIATTVIYAAVNAAIIYGGQALMKSSTKSGMSNSPTYASPTLQTQTNPELPVPLLYGTVRLAGNRIWQNSSSSAKIKRIVAFAEGEIEDFTDIRLNNIKSNKISGCKIEKFYGTSDQKLTSIANLKTVGSLRNIAYLAITCDKTQKIDINYNLTAVVKGRKVRVYTSPTEYEVKYSENPAWCLFDFLTAYNGLGIALDNDCNVNDDLVAKYFDLESFIESAAYCDEQIPYTDSNGNTTYSPRFTFNMIFDSASSARDLIDEIYRSCRGGLFTNNGKLQFKIDKPEPVSQVFTSEDIIKGSESFSVIPSEERYEILRCIYVSPEHEWQKVEAFAELPEYRYGAPVEHSVNLYSCTNFQQASRLAWYYVNRKLLCPYFGSFQTDYRAYTLQVGDVIKIDSLLMGLKNYLVKVTSVKDNGAGVFTVNWQNYDERLYNDTLGSKEPLVLVSDLLDVEAFAEDVKNFNVVQSQNTFNFVWDYNESETDVYEIRMGESWDTGSVIAKNLDINTYSTAIHSTGLYTFWIKAFNKYNYSENATIDRLQVDNIPNMNEIMTINVFETAKGQFDGTYISQGILKLSPVENIYWHNTTDKWGEGETYYQTDGIWGVKIRETGTFISEVFDVGGIYKNTTTYDYKFETADGDNSVRFEYRISDDNVTWSDWNLLLPGVITFRYIQYKIVLTSPAGVPIFLKDFVVYIDMPDVIKNIEAIVDNAETGVVVEYDFNVVPSIVTTVQDNIAKYAVVPQELKTRKNATVFIYDNDGNLTTGRVSLILKGY